MLAAASRLAPVSLRQHCTSPTRGESLLWDDTARIRKGWPRRRHRFPAVRDCRSAGTASSQPLRGSARVPAGWILPPCARQATARQLNVEIARQAVCQACMDGPTGNEARQSELSGRVRGRQFRDDPRHHRTTSPHCGPRRRARSSIVIGFGSSGRWVSHRRFSSQPCGFLMW